MTITEIKSYISNLKMQSDQLEYRLSYMNNRIDDLEDILMEIEDRTFNEKFDRIESLEMRSA
jgi:uncharacterized coiled-coil protein SlyX